MPTGVGTSLLVFGAVLTTVSDIAGCIVASTAVAFEGYLLWRAGR